MKHLYSQHKQNHKEIPPTFCKVSERGVFLICSGKTGELGMLLCSDEVHCVQESPNTGFRTVVLLVSILLKTLITIRPVT